MNEPEKLIACCEDIFEEMKKFYESHQQSCTGFNFSYSPKKSWEAMPNILLLTYHPAPQEDDVLKPHQILWPEKENDFFNPSVWQRRTFPEGILTIAAEIASCKEGIDYKASMDNTELKDFVDVNMVLASFVPFRTTTAGQQDLVKFSKEEYWGEIWQRWQPELIIAAGDSPFDYTGQVLKQLGWDGKVLTEAPTWKFGTRKDKHVPRSQGRYRIDFFTNTASGKKIYVLRVPSPSANWPTPDNPNTNYGYPDSRLYAPNLAPVQDFIRKALYFTHMQRH